MKPTFESKLNSVFAYPLLSAVGMPLNSPATPINNWSAAAKSCRSRKWETCQLMANNALADQVRKISWERSAEWNILAAESVPIIRAKIGELLIDKQILEKFHKNIIDAMSWDIMAICFEDEYKDIVKPIFNIPVLEPWYVAGHFPCGWDGDEFPSNWMGESYFGQPIVY